MKRRKEASIPRCSAGCESAAPLWSAGRTSIASSGMARGRPEARLFEPKRLFWVEAPSSPSDTSREKSPHGIGEASPPDERRTISPDGCWGASLHGCRVKDDLLRKVPFLVEPTFLEIKVPGPSLAAGFPTTCTAMPFGAAMSNISVNDLLLLKSNEAFPLENMLLRASAFLDCTSFITSDLASSSVSSIPHATRVDESTISSLLCSPPQQIRTQYDHSAVMAQHVRRINFSSLAC